uniref:Reverse transcriptase zinc-binding domain-containing protein n=1 Tax=Setaria italica TaxID=4555 RepID=K4A3X1_SETIT
MSLHANARVSFSVTMVINVGNGANTLFWTDRWLNNNSIIDLTPHLFAVV